jgi:hypothetical protein
MKNWQWRNGGDTTVKGGTDTHMQAKKMNKQNESWQKLIQTKYIR